MADNIFGDVLLRDENAIPFNTLKRILERPVIHPRYRLSILPPDEQVSYIIPSITHTACVPVPII